MTDAAVAAASSLDELEFTNRWTTALPADPEDGARLRQVHGAAYSRVQPTPTRAPRTLMWVPEVAELLGLDASPAAGAALADVLSGNAAPLGADPYAAAYGGHQFGSWAGQLGDGRAIALGEVRDARGGHQTLQLKGAGQTPYSRRADGRAVLRSSLRELLASEAMHHLGVPTTRALSLVATGDDVVRDVLYDGHPKPEPGAVVCRVAPSFTRFGTFELPASRGDVGLLRQLVEVTVRLDLPELLDGGELPPTAELATRLFAEVCRRTADLAVDWMRVGFVHGVLNTDNMSILGLTIDYGPFGWLESFDPGWTPNTTDAGTRRYRYGAQPAVCGWNLGQLGSALAPLVDDVEPLQAALDGFGARYADGFAAMTAERLGWGAHRDGDEQLVQDLFRVLTSTEVDQVLFFRDLARVPVDPHGELDDDSLLAPLVPALYAPDELAGDVRVGLVAWLRAWGERVARGGVADADERRRVMDSRNPRFVLRNWLAHEAIQSAEQGDLAPAHDLLDVLRRPYDEQPGRERYAERRPEWARHQVGCSMLSCSS